MVTDGSAWRCPTEIFLTRPPLICRGILPAASSPLASAGCRLLRHLAALRLLAGIALTRSPSNSGGKAFVAFDRELDHARTGPLWLKDARVAECVSRILLSGASEWKLYELFAWVVMANHVHVLLRPRVPLHKALMNVKSASARAANAVLQRAGTHFWQGESFDHWVRNDGERESIVRYIHSNPVKAGLVATPEEWPWSSAGRQKA